MKVTFLGTGTSQGVPVIACKCPVCRSIDYRDKRLRTSIHILTDDDQSIVVDTGPDFRQQMLRERIPKLDAVLFTHEHKDHTAGMDDIRSFYFVQDKKDIPVYARETVLDQLKREFAYVFAAKKYPGVVSIATHEIVNNSPFKIGTTEIIPVEGLHYKLPVFGFRVKDFAYLTDINAVSEEEKEKIKGSKVLVVGALQREPHISHFTLQEALDFIAEVKPEQAYLTHISHRLGFYQEVIDELPENVTLAYDGLILDL